MLVPEFLQISSDSDMFELESLRKFVHTEWCKCQ